MFLTRAELEELTDYKLAYWQCAWLERNGYRFQVGASGRPKVLRSHVEQKLGVMQNASMHSAQPNFAAIQ